MGYSLHAGMVIVADGTEDAEKRLKRVLHNDPAMGVIRHADAGYEIAKSCFQQIWTRYLSYEADAIIDYSSR